MISNVNNFFPPPIAFFVLQKGIEGGLEEIVVCGVVCIGLTLNSSGAAAD